jgi:uncharacterized protein
MPEYLAPGVYVEEVSFRSKSIEGVSTSVAGFLGPARYGPVGGRPELLTSFADFERIYGGLDDLQFAGANTQPNYLAHAVRAFFDNGGSKLYVTRVCTPTDPDHPENDQAQRTVGTAILSARFPGLAGRMQIVFAVRPSPNLLVAATGSPNVAQRISAVRENDVVYLKESVGLSPLGTALPGFYDLAADGTGLALNNPAHGTVRLGDLDPTRHRVHKVTLSVRVRRAGQFETEQEWPDLAPHPLARNALTVLFTDEPQSRLRYLTIPFAISSTAALTSGAQILETLLGSATLDTLDRSLDTDAELRGFSIPTTRPSPAELEQLYTLDQGSDGRLPIPDAYAGEEDENGEKTGLLSFEDIEEISIVAAPGHSAGYLNDPNRVNQIVQSLITHCQIRMRYRVAVLDAPDGEVVSEVQSFRGQFDSTHAALYYPWITIVNPLDPDGRAELELPPSGFVAGIYARNDAIYGVSKAPANEVVLGAVGFETLLNKAQQDVLNPVGVNCFRFFPGRGFRLWGARTISSDPEWKYISNRRYFAYLEHSIDRGTQWAVFANNNEALWANVRQTISDFLFNEWRNGALLGTRPEEAFFVRCDRSTMTQNDLDNGRLVCLIGVAVVKPAEFVIFRIGQFTADRPA